MSSKPFTPDNKAGKRFLMVRKYLKLNQSELSQLLNTSQSMISMIEKGEREISQDMLKTLFVKKNISTTYLVVGEGPVEHKKENKSELLTNIRDLQAEIEIMKSQIKNLYSTRTN